MPREGTKTGNCGLKPFKLIIEIRYAPGGDENVKGVSVNLNRYNIEIRYAPVGDENFIEHI